MEIIKPKVGQPCNGCGICCQIQVCYIGSYLMGLVKNYGENVKKPCPALKSNANGSFNCDIYLNPKKYIKGSKYREDVLKRSFGLVNNIGNGCDSIGYDYEDDEENKALDEIMDRVYKNLDEIKKVIRASEILRDHLD